MQINITMNYQPIPVKTAIIKKMDKNDWRGGGGKWKLAQISTPALENSM